MEFREREGTTFDEAERRYSELERRYDAGQIDEEQFDAERQRLLVVDDEGKWWAKSWETGQWHYHDGGGAWIEATPPIHHRRVGYEDPPVRTEQDLPEQPKRRPTAPRTGSRSRLLIGLGVLGAVIVVVGLIAVLAYSLSGEETAEEAEPETADFSESIVGEWRDTDNEQVISIEFFVDGTSVSTGRGRTNIVGTYKFVDEDTIALTEGNSREQRFDISMPTEDTLVLIPLDEEGNPSQEDALVLRKVVESSAPEEQPTKESIVGEWRGTDNGEDISVEFFADGTFSATERGRTNDGTYRFVDEDTIIVTGEGPEERFDISMPTEDTLILTTPRQDPLVLRK